MLIGSGESVLVLMFNQNVCHPGTNIDQFYAHSAASEMSR